MSIDELAPEELEQKRQQLLDGVPQGEAIGNKKLRDNLGWPEDVYWEVRNLLIENGSLEKGKGKGGSVRRVRVLEPQDIAAEPSPSTLEQDSVSGAAVYSKESDLYGPVADVLRTHWSKEQGFDDYVVHVTALQGARETGGKWSRPDICVFACKTYPYVPNRYFEVITFEVKPLGGADVASVYEALAHRRAATRAYVVAHVPAEQAAECLHALEETVLEAKRWGIGVITVDDPTDFDSWEVLVEAERREPDPGRLNEFIARQTAQETKEQIAKWFK